MIRIDDTLLEEIGLISLPKADRDQLLRQIYETLEMRVGMRLAERMTDQQLDEFERFIDTNDEAGALKWLETNFPDYKQVVADELDKLKGEIKNDSGKILETMQAQPALAQPTQPPAFGATPAQPAQFSQPANPNPAFDQSPTQQYSSPQPTQPPAQSAPSPQPLPPLPSQPAPTGQPPLQQYQIQPISPAAQQPQNDFATQPYPAAPQNGQVDNSSQDNQPLATAGEDYQNIPPPPSFS